MRAARAASATRSPARRRPAATPSSWAATCSGPVPRSLDRAALERLVGRRAALRSTRLRPHPLRARAADPRQDDLPLRHRRSRERRRPGPRGSRRRGRLGRRRRRDDPAADPRRPARRAAGRPGAGDPRRRDPPAGGDPGEREAGADAGGRGTRRRSHLLFALLLRRARLRRRRCAAGRPKPRAAGTASAVSSPPPVLPPRLFSTRLAPDPIPARTSPPPLSLSAAQSGTTRGSPRPARTLCPGPAIRLPDESDCGGIEQVGPRSRCNRVRRGAASEFGNGHPSLPVAVGRRGCRSRTQRGTESFQVSSAPSGFPLSGSSWRSLPMPAQGVNEPIRRIGSPACHRASG